MELIQIIRIFLEFFTIIMFMFTLSGYILFKIKHPDGLKIPIKNRYLSPIFIRDKSQTNLYFRIKYLDSYKLLNGRVVYQNIDRYKTSHELFHSYSDDRDSSSDKKMYKPKTN